MCNIQGVHMGVSVREVVLLTISFIYTLTLKDKTRFESNPSCSVITKKHMIEKFWNNDSDCIFVISIETMFLLVKSRLDRLKERKKATFIEQKKDYVPMNIYLIHQITKGDFQTHILKTKCSEME